MEKKMENEMETREYIGTTWGYIGIENPATLSMNPSAKPMMPALLNKKYKSDMNKQDELRGPTPPQVGSYQGLGFRPIW